MMINFYPFLMDSTPESKKRYRHDITLIVEAGRLYEQVYHQGNLNQLWRWLTRRSGGLLDLAAIEAAANICARHYRGMQTVLIAQIKGSEGRNADFDSGFLPRQSHCRERWVSLAAARMMGVEMPPVELIQVGDTYFVRDGHHRISVARAMGEQYIEAEVTIWEVLTTSSQVRAAIQTA